MISSFPDVLMKDAVSSQESLILSLIFRDGPNLGLVVWGAHGGSLRARGAPRWDRVPRPVGGPFSARFGPFWPVRGPFWPVLVSFPQVIGMPMGGVPCGPWGTPVGPPFSARSWPVRVSFSQVMAVPVTWGGLGISCWGPTWPVFEPSYPFLSRFGPLRSRPPTRAPTDVLLCAPCGRLCTYVLERRHLSRAGELGV